MTEIAPYTVDVKFRSWIVPVEDANASSGKQA